MPDPIVIILFFVFFILPLLEKAMKKRQPPSPPGELEDDDARERPAAPPRSRTPAPVAADAEDDAAADMIPDDLWEILTGERRQRAPSLPEPAGTGERGREARDEREARAAEEWFGGFDLEPAEPADSADAQVYDSEISGNEIAADAIDRAEELREERERAVHTAERAPQRMPDAVVVYEPAVPSPRTPRKLAVPSPPLATVGGRDTAPRHVRRAAGTRLRLGVRGESDRAELRRAFILKEVLDRPKGLE